MSENMTEVLISELTEEHLTIGDIDKLNQVGDLDKINQIQSTLAKKAEEYTTTVGHYTAWRTDVNLNPPDSKTSFTPDDDHIHDYYNALQYSLYENNLPETIDRTDTPREQNPPTGIAITILSSPVECMAILLEGGRQAPGDVLLVMSPSWLTKDKSEKGEGLHSLYVKKAIVFEKGGTSYIDVFRVPRKCTYFVNFFTRACTDGQRYDGEELETDLDCPMSSSIQLCKRVDDKLLTRIMMAEAGVHYPETLAINYKPAYIYTAPNNADMKILNIENVEDSEERIKDELKYFLNWECFQTVRRVVVKPSGVMWHGSRCVTFHDVKNEEDIFRAVIDLLCVLEVENTVLIEGFYATETALNPELSDYSFRLRSTVCRRCDDTPVTTVMTCGIGRKDEPINGDNTIPQSIETTLVMWGFPDLEVKRIVNAVSTGSERLLARIMEHESKLLPDEKGGVLAQTDLIGIDFVLGEVRGRVEPVGIEVNSHDCTINCQLYEFLHPSQQGVSVGPFVETMVRRSQSFLMQGKTVLVIGAGGFSKRFIWDSYKDFGIKTILVDPDDSSYASSLASIFVQYDFSNHKDDQEHAASIIEMLKEKGLHYDGCVTFWEDCGPLAATICNLMNFHGPGQSAAEVAKKKSRTQAVLRSRTGDIPHYPRTYLYAGRAFPIKSPADIEMALKHCGTPAVLKLEYGSSAVGVKPVKDLIECTNTYYNLKSKLTSEDDHPGVGLGHGNDLFLMEYLDGTEHDIDVIIYQRQLIAAFVSDNGPTRKGSFTETSSCMPSCLPGDREGQLMIAAYQCCTEIGLVDGVFNVEMKMTTKGPKLIEINARMAGFYYRDWIRLCFGVDLLQYSFMVCLGIKPVIRKPTPKCQLMGVMCVASVHKKQLSDIRTINILNRMVHKGIVRYNQIEASLDECGSPDSEEPFCHIAVMDSSLAKAKEKLIGVCNLLEVNTDEFDLNYLLKDFHKQ